MKNTFTFIEIRRLIGRWKPQGRHGHHDSSHLWSFILALGRQDTLQTALLCSISLRLFSKVSTTNLFSCSACLSFSVHTPCPRVHVQSIANLSFYHFWGWYTFSCIPCSSAIAVFNARSVDQYSFVFWDGGNQIGELPVYFKWSSWARY